MNRVVLSREEGRWLSRNILKTRDILEKAAKKDPQILDRTTYRTLVKLTSKAQEMQAAIEAFGEEEYEFELMLESKPRVIIRDLLSKTLQSLEEKILPEYKRRGMQDKANETVTKIGLLKAMGRKLK